MKSLALRRHRQLHEPREDQTADDRDVGHRKHIAGDERLSFHDRPAVIAMALVEQGAPALHLVDLDGAVRGRPVNVDAIGAVARAVARPLQVAGGIDGPEQIELAFAAGATRVVMPLWSVAEDTGTLAECLRIGRDWLAVGVDARPESLRDHPWERRPVPSLLDLVVDLSASGVRRFVLSHVASASRPLDRA